MNTRDANLGIGDKITLVENSGGLNLDIAKVRSESPQFNGRNYVSHGVSWNNYVDYDLEGGKLTATVREMTRGELERQTQLLTSGATAVMSQIDYGTARILDWLPPEEIEMKNIDRSTPFEMFTGVGGGVMNVDTGNDSKLRTRDGGDNIGYMRVH